jgi:ABC-2 type transport system permease protein
MTWLGIWLALLVRSPEAVTSAQILVWPLSFLSSAFVAPATMPGWLAAIAYWNPLSATVTAIRQLFGNPVAAGHSWPAQHPLLLAIVWPLAITVVLIPLTAVRYRRLSD